MQTIALDPAANVNLTPCVHIRRTQHHTKHEDTRFSQNMSKKYDLKTLQTGRCDQESVWVHLSINIAAVVNMT